ncbi:MAG: MBL fold metallo-hydrolase [Halioglobus sp.]
MRTVKVLLLIVGILALIAALFATYALNTYKPVPVDPAWVMSSTNTPHESALTVRYTGTSTLLFSDGDTQWMIDGWFSRPGVLALAGGKIGPDLQAITEGLAANKVTALAAVIPMHSHYDHAMDSPEVARRTGAMLMGSESTANIARGWGLPENQIRVFENRTPVRVGDFTITPIESQHFQFADPEVRERALSDPKISKPLIPPVPVFGYKLGKAYVLHVSHPKGNFIVVGSAGYLEGVLQGFDADTIFLGIGGLGSQTEPYRQGYWRETVEVSGAQRVIPIHYDSLTGPITGPFKGPVTAMAFLSGGVENTLTFLQGKGSENPGLLFQTLPRYDEVMLYP